MTHPQQFAPEMRSGRPAGILRRLRPIVIAVIAIGLATGAAFVALVWLDGSTRFLTPSVIRLGQPEPAAGAPLAAIFAAGRDALRLARTPAPPAYGSAGAH